MNIKMNVKMIINTHTQMNVNVNATMKYEDKCN